MFFGKINVKKSILEIVEKNNLEILKIDLCNDDESFVRFYGEGRDESCKVYTTLEDLDFEIDSIDFPPRTSFITTRYNPYWFFSIFI